jgi:hypothetical protein
MRGCDKLADLIALYASGDLDDSERARVEAHLADCAECRRALAEMRTLVTAASAERVTPPEELGSRIADQVSRRAALAPARGSLRWSVALGYVGAATVVFAAGMLLGYQLTGVRPQPPPELRANSGRRFAFRPPGPGNQEQPGSNAHQPFAIPTPPSSTSSDSSQQVIAEPPPLKAPMPPTEQDVRIAALPEPEGPETGSASTGRPDESPSRGPRALGLIRGRVTYNGAGVAAVHVRLVRADGSFVPGAGATTDEEGQYQFRNVASGAYRVYAYTGDNPLYFNRCSRLTRTRRHAASVGDLELAMVIESQEPRLGATLAGDSDVTFRWTECRGATGYDLTVSDEASGDEVFSVHVTAPFARAPAARFTSGHEYRWQVRATGTGGAFLGGSPGAGGEPWGFRVR